MSSSLSSSPSRLGSINDRRCARRPPTRRKISSQLTVERRCYSPHALVSGISSTASATKSTDIRNNNSNSSSTSSPTEMKQRRCRGSVRREQYYGSVELVVSMDPGGKIRNIGRFRVEPGPDVDYTLSSISNTTSPVIVENPQTETRWYWKYFLGNEHQNFAGIDPHTKAPFFMSIMVEDETDGNRLCRAILWTAAGPRRLLIPMTSNTKLLTAKHILQHFPGFNEFSRSLKEIANPKVQKDLCILEDQEGCVNCKFGVIFARANQVSDAEMLSNEHGNEDFERFTKLLGQRIELHDWGSYRGGLDTTTNSTGRESVYTAFSGHEIMFHVSTLLPYSKDNNQQIERKRHVGNDIVNIVFENAADPRRPNFSPTMMKSHFTHVFTLITYDASDGCYRLWTFSEESVPAFGPALPHPNEFYDHSQFREFLLTKLINAEKAAFQAKVFVEKRHRTNDTLLKDMYIEYLKECHRFQGFHKVTDAVIKHLRSPIRKDAPKEAVDFCKYGELFKLEKMLSGDVCENATKLAYICRKQPWEPEPIFCNALQWDSISTDCWGNSSLLLATEDTGVIFMNEGLSVPIIDAAARVQQLAALEHFGLFLARVDKGKEASLCVFSLADLRLAIQSGNMISKKTCIDRRLAVTKGCHLFGTSDPNGLRLNIVVCIGKRLVLLRWAFGPLGIIQASDLTRNFTELEGMTLNEEPTAVSVFEKGTPHGTVKAVLAVKNNLLIIADFGAHSYKYVSIGMPKATLSCVIGAVDGDEDEIVFAYDNITVIIEVPEDGQLKVQETFWSSKISAVVCRFPFIVGFGQDIIEIRLAINGNLLNSMYIPGVKLLSAKDDVILAAERVSCASSSATTISHERPLRASVMRKHTDHNSSTANTVSQPKRWDLYRISAKNLHATTTTTSTNGAAAGGGNTDRRGGVGCMTGDRPDSSLGSLTPQLLRNPSYSNPRLNRPIGDQSTTIANRNGGSTTAFDSGFSSRGHPSGTDGSMPNSPIIATTVDPFAESDAIL